MGSAFFKVVELIKSGNSNLEIEEQSNFDPLVFTILNGNPSDPELLEEPSVILKSLKLRGLVRFAKKTNHINSNFYSIFDHCYEYETLNSSNITKPFLEIYNYLFVDYIEWTIDHQIWPFEN